MQYHPFSFSYFLIALSSVMLFLADGAMRLVDLWELMVLPLLLIPALPAIQHE
jgi:hypothetical protein